MRFAWITEPPFNFLDGGKLTGCDVELVKYAFSELGETFEPVHTTFADMLPGLEDGRWDVTTGMFITPERAVRAHFTNPIWALRDGLLVAKQIAGSVSGYRTLSEMNGKIAVLRGQVQRGTALSFGISENRIAVFNDYGEAAQAVVNGDVLAYSSVELAHRAYLDRNPDNGLTCVAIPGTEKPADAGGLACGNSRIRNDLNKVLQGIVGTPRHDELLRSFGLDPQSLAI